MLGVLVTGSAEGWDGEGGWDEGEGEEKRKRGVREEMEKGRKMWTQRKTLISTTYELALAGMFPQQNVVGRGAAGG